MYQSLLDILFPPPTSTKQFLSMGCLFGRFTPNTTIEENLNLNFVRGTLHFNEVVYLNVFLASRLYSRLSKSPTFNSDNAYLWRVFFRTTPEGKLHQVQLIRSIPIEGHSSLDNPPSWELGTDQFRIRGEIRYADELIVVLRLRRNEKAPKGYEKSRHWSPFYITVNSGLPLAVKGQFWDLLCIRKGETLVVKEAYPVKESPLYKQQDPLLNPVATKILFNLQVTSESAEGQLVRKSDTLTSISQTTKTPTNYNLSSPNQVIMIPGLQAEITVKFNTRPSLPETGKTVLLEVTTELGFLVRANVNRKTFKKQVEKMDTFTDWIAALSGRIIRVDSEGVIELEGASVAVFEKKVKEETKSEVKSEVEAVNQTVEV